MKKKSIYILAICSLLLFIACANKTDLNQKFIEDNFLKMVDTTAYITGSFRKPPNSLKKKLKLLVELNPEINYNKDIDDLVINFFKNNTEYEAMFKNLINDDIPYCEFLLDEKFPKKIGKYSINFKDSKLKNSSDYVGMVDIQNFKISQNKAMLVLSKSEEKSSITYIVLLIKDANKWKIIKTETLSQS
jgi:hypothetical protein